MFPSFPSPTQKKKIREGGKENKTYVFVSIAETQKSLGRKEKEKGNKQKKEKRKGNREMSTRQPVVRYGLYCFCVLLLVGYCISLSVTKDETASKLAEVARDVLSKSPSTLSPKTYTSVHVLVFERGKEATPLTLTLVGETHPSCDEHKDAVLSLVRKRLREEGNQLSLLPTYHMLPHPALKSVRLRACLLLSGRREHEQEDEQEGEGGKGEVVVFAHTEG